MWGVWCVVSVQGRALRRGSRGQLYFILQVQPHRMLVSCEKRSQEPRRRSLVSARPRIDRTVESHARRRRQYASSVLRLSKERIASQRARLSVHAIAIMIVAMMQLTLSHAGPCRRPHVS